MVETALVRRYLADTAPWIQPKAVELHVEGVIAGLRVQGIVDLLDMEGRSGRLQERRAPAGIIPDYNLQLTTYSMITPGLLQTRHRHEDQDGAVGAAELRNRTGKNTGMRKPDGAGVHAGWDLSPASQQLGLFSPVLWVLARMRAGGRVE